MTTAMQQRPKSIRMSARARDSVRPQAGSGLPSRTRSIKPRDSIDLIKQSQAMRPPPRRAPSTSRGRETSPGTTSRDRSRSRPADRRVSTARPVAQESASFPARKSSLRRKQGGNADSAAILARRASSVRRGTRAAGAHSRSGSALKGSARSESAPPQVQTTPSGASGEAPRQHSRRWAVLGSLFGKKSSSTPAPALVSQHPSPAPVAPQAAVPSLEKPVMEPAAASHFPAQAPPPPTKITPSLFRTRSKSATSRQRDLPPKREVQRASTVPMAADQPYHPLRSHSPHPQPLQQQQQQQQQQNVLALDSVAEDDGTDTTAARDSRSDITLPILDVEIPNVELERYSIMFGNVLGAKPNAPSPPSRSRNPSPVEGALDSRRRKPVQGKPEPSRSARGATTAMTVPSLGHEELPPPARLPVVPELSPRLPMPPSPAGTTVSVMSDQRPRPPVSGLKPSVVAQASSSQALAHARRPSAVAPITRHNRPAGAALGDESDPLPPLPPLPLAVSAVHTKHSRSTSRTTNHSRLPSLPQSVTTASVDDDYGDHDGNGDYHATSGEGQQNRAGAHSRGTRSRASTTTAATAAGGGDDASEAQIEAAAEVSIARQISFSRRQCHVLRNPMLSRAHLQSAAQARAAASSLPLRKEASAGSIIPSSNSSSSSSSPSSSSASFSSASSMQSSASTFYHQPASLTLPPQTTTTTTTATATATSTTTFASGAGHTLSTPASASAAAAAAVAAAAAASISAAAAHARAHSHAHAAASPSRTGTPTTASGSSFLRLSTSSSVAASPTSPLIHRRDVVGMHPTVVQQAAVDVEGKSQWVLLECV